jgi:hypothetical protein
VSKLSGWQKVDNPLFNFTTFDIKTRRNDTALIKTSRQLNDNLVGTVIVNNFKFTNVTWNGGGGRCNLLVNCIALYGETQYSV